MTCSYGNLVTMATEACIYNFAVCRYMKSLFGTQIPLRQQLSTVLLVAMGTLLHDYIIRLYLCCLKANEVHIWFTDHLRQQQSIMICCYGNLVNMATEVYAYIFAAVQRSLEATTIHHMICCYGNLVTMATETYVYIFAV